MAEIKPTNIETYSYDPKSIAFSDKVKLYFFDPAKSLDEYADLFLSTKPFNNWITSTHKIVKASPLYQLRHDIHLCYGREKGLPQNIEYPNKAGILLINIALQTISRDVYSINLDNNIANSKEFFTDFLNLNIKDCIALRLFRNALVHNGYKFQIHDKNIKTKASFFLSLDSKNIVEEISANTQNGTKNVSYHIQPRKLFSHFNKCTKNLQKKLLNDPNDKLALKFNKKCDLSDWNWITLN